MGRNKGDNGSRGRPSHLWMMVSIQASVSGFNFSILTKFMLALIVLSSITKNGEIVRKMAPLGYCLWFWWLSNNAINGTNEFIKWTIIVPRDKTKRPGKAKHEERTQRNAELDEFCRNQLHQNIRWYMYRTASLRPCRWLCLGLRFAIAEVGQPNMNLEHIQH